MSILAKKLLRGVVPEPQKVVIYGPQGVGKSELAANAFPEPIFLDTEKGSRRLNVDRVPIETYEEFIGVVRDPALLAYGTAVVDTVDWLEAKAADFLCRTHHQKSIESNEKNSPFSYGKGVVMLGETMMSAILELDKLVAKGLNVVLLGHSIVRKIDLPDVEGAYDRVELDLNQKHVAPIIKHWTDALLFYNFKMAVRIKEEGFGREKTEAEKVRGRVIYTTHNAAADAKNRHGLKDEEPVTTVASGVEIIKRAFANVNAPWGKPANVAPVVVPAPKPTPAKLSLPPAQSDAPVASTPTTSPEGAPVGETGIEPLNAETPPARASEAAPVIDGIPGLLPENGGPSEDQFLIVLKGHEESALAWLRARGRITPTQHLKDVDAATRARVLANPARFIETIAPKEERA